MFKIAPALGKLFFFVITVLMAGQVAAGDVPATAAAASPAAKLPYTPGLDPSAMDRAADPCEDFYQYTCGGWMKNNPIPSDHASWDVYSKLSQENRSYLWGILNDLAARRRGLTPVQEKLGNYFAACMDEAAVEQQGAAPLGAELSAIAALPGTDALGELLARLHLDTGDGSMFFSFSANQDYKDAKAVIAFVGAGGLGLPDRDYYLKDDTRSRGILAAYAAHITRMMQLTGLKPFEASRAAEDIIALESALARASLSRVELRDPQKLAHKYGLKELQALTPKFAWARYLAALGVAGVTTFNVTEPAFFRALNHEWQTRSLDEIKTYLRWQLVRDSAQALSGPFRLEHFSFFDKTLRGIPEPPPRWQQCVELVNGQLGEALGEEYVARNFSPALKEQVLDMTRRIERAMKDEIRELDWMSPATKRRAEAKLAAVANKIGYPDHWRDYSGYSVDRHDFAGNVRRGTQFEVRRQLAKIGRPLDRGEWAMTPQTVNAYYDPQMNDINFPAGILQPPLYDQKMDAATNYGDSGGTIGHELTHGFDDEGRQFDGQGNLKDWWTKGDAAEFTRRAECIVDQYARYTVVDDIKINSRLTLGEDVADLGGLVLAWRAWRTATAGSSSPSRDGFSPEQRFFIGFSQWACANNRPENKRVDALTDPHSPAKYRVNGVVVNFPQFAQAFHCKASAAMVSKNPCRVW